MSGSGKNKRPAFQFYAGDFLSDYNVVCMNMAQRGIYITLLAHAWLEGGIPDNTDKIKRLCGNPIEWDDDWNVVRDCFELVDGDLVNPRMERERLKQIERSEKARINGALGGKAKQTLSKRLPKAKQTLSSSKKKKNEDEFEEFWKLWSTTNRKADKKRAKDSYIKALKSEKHDVIMKGLASTIEHWAKTGKETKYIPHASTWLNGERWNDDIPKSNAISNVVTKTHTYTYTCDKCKSQVIVNDKLKSDEVFCDCGGELLSKYEYQQMMAKKQENSNAPSKARAKEEEDFMQAFGGMVENISA